MLKEMQVFLWFYASGTWKHTVAKFSFLFLHFPKKTNILDCEKIGKLLEVAFSQTLFPSLLSNAIPSLCLSLAWSNLLLTLG